MNSFKHRICVSGMSVIEPTLVALEEFQEHDSGWALSRILDLTVREQIQSYARRMLHQITARHNEESDDQRAIDG